MLEKWGLIVYWDNSNDCYIASVPELLACIGTGQSRKEALEALEQEVEYWRKTSREIDYSHTASETEPQALTTRGLQPARLKAAKPPNMIELSKPLANGPLTITTACNLPIVFLAGEGDVSNCLSLRQACDDIFALGQRGLVIDMTDLVYLDSSVLGVLVNVLRKFRSIDGFVCLVRSREPNVNRLFNITRFNITRFDSIFWMFDNLEEALEKLKTP